MAIELANMGSTTNEWMCTFITSATRFMRIMEYQKNPLQCYHALNDSKLQKRSSPHIYLHHVHPLHLWNILLPSPGFAMSWNDPIFWLPPVDRLSGSQGEDITGLYQPSETFLSLMFASLCTRSSPLRLTRCICAPYCIYLQCADTVSKSLFFALIPHFRMCESSFHGVHDFHHREILL